MMRLITFPHFRPGVAIAACSLGLAVAGAYQAPGLMQAILVVGANAQLPLERLAAQADQPASVSATAVSSAWKEHLPAQAKPAAQKLEGYTRPERDRRAHRDVHGYEHSLTDYKYWT
ncbi:hypothetical protein [Paraburkholderia bengalensis]